MFTRLAAFFIQVHVFFVLRNAFLLILFMYFSCIFTRSTLWCGVTSAVPAAVLSQRAPVLPTVPSRDRLCVRDGSGRSGTLLCECRQVSSPALEPAKHRAPRAPGSAYCDRAFHPCRVAPVIRNCRMHCAPYPVDVSCTAPRSLGLAFPRRRIGSLHEGRARRIPGVASMPILRPPLVSCAVRLLA